MRLYVPLNWREFEALQQLANAERRRPRDQAAVILAQALTEELTRPAGDPESSIEATPDRKAVEAACASA